jgi:hypothetical protein
MINLNDFDSFHLGKSRNRILRKIIIQKGPLLYKLDSLRDSGLKVNVKKIQLEQRPDSLSCLTQRKSTLPSPKPRFGLGDSISRYRCQERSFYKDALKLDYNPFQNEALKIPLSKRSFSVTRKLKN